MLSLEALMQCWHESSCIVKPGERDLAHQLLSDSASAAEGALLFLLPTSKPFLTSGWSSLGFALHAESLSVERCLKRNNLDALTGFRSTAPACWSGRMRCKPPLGVHAVARPLTLTRKSRSNGGHNALAYLQEVIMMHAATQTLLVITSSIE